MEKSFAGIETTVSFAIWLVITRQIPCLLIQPISLCLGEKIRRDKKFRAKEGRAAEKRSQTENSDSRSAKKPKRDDSQATRNDAPKTNKIEPKNSEAKKVLEQYNAVVQTQPLLTTR